MSKLSNPLSYIFLFSATCFSIDAYATEPLPFIPENAFCDRQTMYLKSTDEVDAWLQYLGGLRTGQSQPPDPQNCASATVRLVFSAVTSRTEEAAKSQRIALMRSYENIGAQNDSIGAANTEIMSRYLNDLNAASLLWLVCPTIDGSKKVCFSETISYLNEEYVKSSPVLCDFAKFENTERPDLLLEGAQEWRDLPGLCGINSHVDSSESEWLSAFSRQFGE